MIPAAKTIANTTAPGTATKTAGAQDAATPFDAILTLETLAATTIAADAAAAGFATLEDFSLEGLAEGELVSGEDSDTDDGEDGEGIDALAFLADLLNVAVVTPQISTGAAGDGTVSAEADPVSLTGVLADAGKDAASDKSSALAALQALPAQAESTDQGRQDDDISNTTRAADFIQAARHAPAGPERSGIATHVRDPRWAEEFGARIALMVRANESSASLQLSPVDLGPMDVSVTIKDNQANIHFGAAQAETRALIEASIPRLREMLAAQGFNLMDASVSQGFSRQTRGDVPPTARGDSEPEVEAVSPTRISVSGLLDLYA